MRKSIIPSFIQKTWEIIENQEYSHTLRWLPEGFSFQILDQNLFSTQILPKYFKHSNFSSFVRQLNMYNFHKRKTNTGAIEFHHKLFRRGLRQLLVGIKRKPSQADILYGDELIRRYAPEITSQTVQFEQKLQYNLAKDQIFSAMEVQSPQFTGGLCLINWMQNNGQFMRKTLQKKIRQNVAYSIIKIILKTPPQFNDIENRGY